MASALEGVRVLDMTIWQQGSYGTAMLADLGADVIKIEGPDTPDPGRGTGSDSPPGTLGAYFESHNRSKRAIAIDLKQERGRGVVYRLAESADVFVSNMRRPALKRLGCDYDTISRINPGIVYTLASGYGPQGPDRDTGSMDIMAQARGGIMSVTGPPDEYPMPAGVPIADHVGALCVAFGTMTGLFHKACTGEGQLVDASLLAGQLCIQSFNITCSLFNKNTVPPRRERATASPTWNVYRGSDGRHFVIGMGQDRYWPGICKTVGKPEWLDDERYKTAALRLKNARALVAELDEVFATRTADEWVRLFSEADLLAARANDYSEVANDPQNLVNGYIAEVEARDGAPPVKMVGPPVRFSKIDARIRHLAPRLGEHTEEVLREAGYSASEIDELARDGVISVGARAKVAAK